MNALLVALVLAQFPTPFTVKDEGVPKGTATGVNCTGAGVTCSVGVGGVWVLDGAAGGGGGAPTTAQYWTGAADAGLSAERNLGALATGLVLNTGGVPSAYAGATCTTPNLVQTLSASGAPGCYQLKLDELANPGASKSFTMANKNLVFTFTAPTGADGAFEIEAIGGYTGDLLHVHQHTGSPVAGTDLIHAEAASANVLPLRLTAASAATQAASITGIVTASSFSGPLTGAVTGNASTASALASDGADCVGGGEFAKGITAAGVASGCAVPPGTYTLPAASTTLGGTKMAAACSAGNHVSSIGAGGELTCSADSGGGGANALGTYLVQTATNAPANAQVMALLGTGLVKNTTTTGVQSIAAAGTDYGPPTSANATGLVLSTTGTGAHAAYGGTSCTNQFPRSLNGSGAATCAGVGVADFTANQGTTAQVLHGNAAGQPTWAAVDLSADTAATALPVSKGGMGKTTLTSAGAIPLGTAGTTTYTDLAGGAVGTILHNSAANTPAWLTNGTTTGQSLLATVGAAPSWGYPGYRRTGSNYTNGTTTASAITGLSWPVASGVPSAFRCQMAVLNGNAASSIRYGVNGPTMTTIVLKYQTHKASVTTEVVEQFTATTTTVQTAGVTTGVATTAHIDTIEGVIIPSANGTIQINAAGSAAQTSTVYQGSSCFVF